MQIVIISPGFLFTNVALAQESQSIEKDECPVQVQIGYGGHGRAAKGAGVDFQNPSNSGAASISRP